MSINIIMKIIGIGIDICKNQRMQKILNSTIKQRFLAKVLHPQELKTDVSAQYLASR